MSERETILKDREAVYGPLPESLCNLATMWTAILRHHYRDPTLPMIPGYVAGLMMAAQKTLRAASPAPLHQDNYDDGHNFLDAANELERRRSADSDQAAERDPSAP